MWFFEKSKEADELASQVERGKLKIHANFDKRGSALEKFSGPVVQI